MPPKGKSSSASASKTATSAHASYVDMVKEAIIQLKERMGSSRQSIKKYVKANNKVDNVSETVFTVQLNKAIKRGVDNGTFTQPKGPSGPLKLASKDKAAAPATKASKPAAEKKEKAEKSDKATKSTTKKAPAVKKASAPKKASATKKTTAKATTKKAPAAKKTATKANTSKTRKTPSAAPAVEEKAPVVLGKTKSGRVTKSKAPQPDKAVAGKKKAPAKKATKAKA